MITKLSKVDFPIPSDRNVNMMPFILGDISSLPSELREYSTLLDACPIAESEKGRVGFLTVQEKIVVSGETARRGGIHTDADGTSSWGGGTWGGYETGTSSGIYIANSLDESCMAWDCLDFETGPGGQVLMGDKYPEEEGTFLISNTVYHITDRTPHVSLPVRKTSYRKFFRLVTSNVSRWFAANSTANPLGIMPSCEIINTSKF